MVWKAQYTGCPNKMYTLLKWLQYQHFLFYEEIYKSDQAYCQNDVTITAYST